MECQKPGCGGTATHMIDMSGQSETWYACDCVLDPEDGLVMQDGFIVSEHLPEDIDELAKTYPPSTLPYPTQEDGVRALKASMETEYDDWGDDEMDFEVLRATIKNTLTTMMAKFIRDGESGFTHEEAIEEAVQGTVERMMSGTIMEDLTEEDSEAVDRVIQDLEDEVPDMPIEVIGAGLDGPDRRYVEIFGEEFSAPLARWAMLAMDLKERDQPINSPAMTNLLKKNLTEAGARLMKRIEEEGIG